MRTIAYVDAFNLYYGCLRGTRYKWLDVAALSRKLLPAHSIQRVKYFTARISPRPSDPGQAQRQQAYLRALSTRPEIEIHFGHDLSHVVRMPLADRSPAGPRTSSAIKTEGKGSDVNLATHLVSDAYERACDAAVLITNDSDLAYPVELVAHRLGMPVGVMNPHPRPARALHRIATFYKQIRAGVLADAQLPVKLQDDRGLIHRPARWA